MKNPWLKHCHMFRPCDAAMPAADPKDAGGFAQVWWYTPFPAIRLSTHARHASAVEDWRSRLDSCDGMHQGLD